MRRSTLLQDRFSSNRALVPDLYSVKTSHRHCNRCFDPFIALTPDAVTIFMNETRYPIPTQERDESSVPGRTCNNHSTDSGTVSLARSNSLHLETAVLQSSTNVSCSASVESQLSNTSESKTSNWRHTSDETRQLRLQNVIRIERLLRNHQPHDILTQVPENCDWPSRILTLALKIERLMFTTATSRENYLDESTLRQRMQRLSCHLLRLRKRKNTAAAPLVGRDQ
ncbi:hypothetical protein Plhal304r1_c094g0172951 [Plasmopara halstedii]